VAWIALSRLRHGFKSRWDHHPELAKPVGPTMALAGRIKPLMWFFLLRPPLRKLVGLRLASHPTS